jgi:hypothetical protein
VFASGPRSIARHCTKFQRKEESHAPYLSQIEEISIPKRPRREVVYLTVEEVERFVSSIKIRTADDGPFLPGLSLTFNTGTLHDLRKLFGGQLERKESCLHFLFQLQVILFSDNCATAEYGDSQFFQNVVQVRPGFDKFYESGTTLRSRHGLCALSKAGEFNPTTQPDRDALFTRPAL